MSIFKGFVPPTENFSKLPHEFIGLLPEIDSLAELKIVLYILRHTWGFSEFDKPKKMTLDELQNGRKRRDQSRMDGGTGLSINSIKAGVEKAVERGILIVETDESDLARIEKWYCLNMSDESNFDTGLSKVDSLPSKVDNRTEKETKERKESSMQGHKTDETKGAYKLKGIEAAMFQDRKVEEDDLPQWENREKAACNAFESAFGIERPWNWYPAKGTQEKEWRELREYLVQLYEADPACFTGYAKWASDKYSRGAKNASQIRQDPGCFPTAWAAYKVSGMYVNPTSQSTTYTDDEGIPLT